MINFDSYIGDISALLRKHYERTQREFKGRTTEQNKHLPWIDTKQDEMENLLNAGLLAWITQHLQTQPQAIMTTTRNDANRSIQNAMQELDADDEEITATSVAVTAGVINRRRLFGRIGGIATTETQSAAESTKLIEAEVISGRRPFTLPADPFAMITQPEEEISPGTKQWITVQDSRVRQTHVVANRQTVPIDSAFNIGGFQMRHPGDMTLGAPIREWVRCRCGSLLQIEGF